MKRNKAAVIASWKPINPREQLALREFLVTEMNGSNINERMHPGGTGKLGMNTGRVVR